MIFYEEEFWNKIYKEKIAAWGYEPAECLKKWIKEFPENATVLDLGCGSGRNANYLAQNGFKVYGYDWSEEAIEQAKKENYSEWLLEGSAIFNIKDLMTQSWDWAINCRGYWGFMKYDVVIDFGYFHFFAPELRPHYHEQLNKVLKTGGIYINESGRDKVDMPMEKRNNPLNYVPPSLTKDVWEEFDYLNIEKLEEKILPPHGDFGRYPCWNVFARKL
jgi:cyclopropane fatty-acyl-phospholipid synthase-like methyltransferase